LTGRLKLTGDGDGSVNKWNLLRAVENSPARINAENCLIKINPTLGTATDNFTCVSLWADDSRWNLFAQNISLTGMSGKTSVLVSVGSTRSWHKLFLDTFTNSVDSLTIGVSVSSLCTYSSFDVIVKNVTTAGSNGTGVHTDVGGDYNSIRGVSRGCDGANLNNLGAGNSISGLVV
jgi:hypothetical protein